MKLDLGEKINLEGVFGFTLEDNLWAGLADDLWCSLWLDLREGLADSLWDSPGDSLADSIRSNE